MPERTGTNRRFYTDAEVERLGLLRDLTRAGHSIGTIAQLATEKLRQLSSEGSRSGATVLSGSSPLLEECVAAVRRLSAPKLEKLLNQGALELGTQGLLQKLIAPLAQVIGDLWRDGTISAAHEHFASAVIRIFLGHASKSFVAAVNGPMIVVATPHAQLHELGALLVGATAANLGWNVTYLGASLPAAEIAGAARQSHARAVALSIVYPEDDPRMELELARLRELLPEGMIILAGGRAAPAYRKTLEKIGAWEMKDLAHLSATLDQLRKSPRKLE